MGHRCKDGIIHKEDLAQVFCKYGKYEVFRAHNMFLLVN